MNAPRPLTGHDHDHLPGDHDHGHHDHGDHDHHGHHDHDHHHDGLWAGLKHALIPHSHDHAERTDDALERSAAGIRAVKISLAALMVTAVAQLAIVLLTGSTALLADTIHNFSDALTAIPLWIAFVLGRRAPTRRYTYGYGRAEDVAGLFIVAMILLSAALAIWQGIDRLIYPRPVEHLGILATAGVVGFLGNELVAVYRIRVGTRIGSAALVADGRHARTDGLTSLAVVLGALGVWLGFPQADPIIGLLIGVAILGVLWQAGRDVLGRLMDAVDPRLVDDLTTALADTPSVTAVSDVRARWMGHQLTAEATVEGDPGLSLAAARELAEAARSQVRARLPQIDTISVTVS